MTPASFTNSLGMPFTPVPGAFGMFCIWPTRRRDYEAYARSVQRVDRTWMGMEYNGRPVGHEPDHPVVGVSLRDAKGFVRWLTRYEQMEGFIGPHQEYRLPLDSEWSDAVGLEEQPRDYPFLKCSGVEDVYPFEGGWPPKPDAGNYCDASLWPEYREDLIECQREFRRWEQTQASNERATLEDVDAEVEKGAFLTDHQCGYETTSPVGSFRPNRFGLYDMGGNVWEWVMARHDPWSKNVVLRGGAWATCRRKRLLSSYRLAAAPDTRFDRYGFRCVLVDGD